MDKKYEGMEETDRDLAMCNDGWKRPGSKSATAAEKPKSTKSTSKKD